MHGIEDTAIQFIDCYDDRPVRNRILSKARSALVRETPPVLVFIDGQPIGVRSEPKREWCMMELTHRCCTGITGA